MSNLLSHIAPPPRTNLPVFVYGSLCPGEANHAVILDGRTDSQRPAHLPNAKLQAGDGYPWVDEAAGGAGVDGWLLEVKAHEWSTVLAELDHLEGFDPDEPGSSHYVRRARLVTLADGSQRTAWVYLFPAAKRREPQRSSR